MRCCSGIILKESLRNYRNPSHILFVCRCSDAHIFHLNYFSRYAEEVESRLRSIGLVCNIGYPPPEIPIADTIDRIVRTGTLYAIVLQISNVQHRSLTLNVLHGTRQGKKTL